MPQRTEFQTGEGSKITMKIVKKMLAIGAAAALATGGLLAVTASPAAAAQEITFTPAGPFKGGEKVMVTATGFTPSKPIAMGMMPVSRYPAKGAGDACASKLGCSALLVSDASGKVSKELVVVKGKIENSTAPAESCDADNDCVFGAANIENPAETTKSAVIQYEAAAAAPAPVESADAPATTDTSTESSDELASTGPGETLIVGLLGVAVFQIGLILAVRAMRRTPRRMHI